MKTPGSPGQDSEIRYSEPSPLALGFSLSLHGHSGLLPLGGEGHG